MLNLAHIQENLPQSLYNNKYLELFSELTNMQNPKEWHGAVNIVFIENKVVMIKRSQTMPSHKGQVAFIGGSRNSGESDPVKTAFREFEEETSISSNELNLIGIMPPVYTAHMKKIISVVSSINMSPKEFSEKVESNGEWDLIFAADSKGLFDKSSWSFSRRNSEKGTSTILYRPVLSEEYQLLKSYQTVDATSIMKFWGASARMFWNLLRVTSK